MIWWGWTLIIAIAAFYMGAALYREHLIDDDEEWDKLNLARHERKNKKPWWDDRQ